MSLEQQLAQRASGVCELCGHTTSLAVYEVSHADGRQADTCALLCPTCIAQIDRKEELNRKHLACLNTSIWSEVPSVQVISWRLLNRMRSESWANELLEMMYLEEDRLAWAKKSGDHESDGRVDLHRDCNGAQLFAGDTVVLTKSLDVKGSTVNARLGTVVRNIRLVADNTEQIEGRIEGQQIVILTQYLRKQHKAEEV